jgi:putative addiction module component (TIGR02574 family)
MTMPVEQLEAAALALPVHDRARLVERLIERLDTDEDEDPAEVERAWEEEIRRRLEEHRAGRGTTYLSSDVIAEARARLK